MLSKVCVFRQKAVTRVDSYCARDFRRRDNAWNVQVTVDAFGRTDTDRLIRQQYVF
ncbi:Uncharacterised protein [Vibrio cholerae]|nr:Uncharacterised protein [Vibrio cholerae]CSI51900.1 Uncharacterised protein [Vibrio cholerae]